MAGASSRGEATPENFPYMLFKSFFERHKDFVLCALFSPQSECHLALTGELSGRSAEILAINAK
jgi:hypothetical protein